MYYKCAACKKVLKSKRSYNNHVNTFEHYEGHEEYTPEEYNNMIIKRNQELLKKLRT